MIKLIQIALIVIVLCVIGIILNQGIKKHEKWECEKWEIQSQTYKGFYWTTWQKEQCNK